MEPSESGRTAFPKPDADIIRKKLRLAEGLYQMAYRVKRFQLKRKHPELSDRELNHRAYALIEKGCK